MESGLVAVQPDHQGAPQGLVAELSLASLDELVVLLLVEDGGERVEILLVLVEQALLLVLIGLLL